MIDKEALKGEALIVVAIIGTIAICFAIVAAIYAIFESELWRAVIGLAIIITVVFVYSYHKLKNL